MTYLRAFAACLAGILFITCVAYVWFPYHHHLFFLEDSLVENLSALFFFSSFLLAVRKYRGIQGHKGFMILVASLGLLCFLEELSFGERVFHFSAPRLHGVKIDALHDFLYLGFTELKMSAHSGGMLILLLTAAGLTVCAAAVVFSCRKVLDRVVSLFRMEQYCLLASSVALMFFAQVIDLETIRSTLLFMLEEVFEMSSGLALCFIAFSMPVDKACPGM